MEDAIGRQSDFLHFFHYSNSTFLPATRGYCICMASPLGAAWRNVAAFFRVWRGSHSGIGWFALAFKRRPTLWHAAGWPLAFEEEKSIKIYQQTYANFQRSTEWELQADLFLQKTIFIKRAAFTAAIYREPVESEITQECSSYLMRCQSCLPSRQCWRVFCHRSCSANTSVTANQVLWAAQGGTGEALHMFRV